MTREDLAVGVCEFGAEMAKESWPFVPLGKIIAHRKEFIQINDLKAYKRCRVQLHAQGIVLRDTVLGAEIKTKKQQVCHSGEFLVAEIDAKVGGFGIVPESLEEAIVSSHYFLFTLDERSLDCRFLDYYIRTRSFRDQITAQGSTNYAAIRPEDVLGYKIPFPPLDEQRRIVSRIEELAARIEEARELRQSAITESKALLTSTLHDIFNKNSVGWNKSPMNKVILINDKQVDPNHPDFSKLPHISGENIESQTCKLFPYRTAEEDGIKSGNYLFSPNTILYSKIRPYLKKATFVDFHGLCSADIYPIKIHSERLEPRFVMWSLVASPFTQYANNLSGRTRMPKLNRKQLLSFELCYPIIEVQRLIVAHLDALQSRLDALKRHQAETAAALDALLPAVLERAFRGEL